MNTLSRKLGLVAVAGAFAAIGMASQPAKTFGQSAPSPKKAPDSTTAATPETFVDALNFTFGKQTTQRATHAKGVVLIGQVHTQRASRGREQGTALQAGRAGHRALLRQYGAAQIGGRRAARQPARHGHQISPARRHRDRPRRALIQRLSDQERGRTASILHRRRLQCGRSLTDPARDVYADPPGG